MTMLTLCIVQQIYAFMKILGNFIVNSNPSISNLAANGITSSNTAFNPASDWPPYSIYEPVMLLVNQL